MHNYRFLCACIIVLSATAGCKLETPDECPMNPTKEMPGNCGCDWPEVFFQTASDELVCDYCYGNEAAQKSDACDCSLRDILDQDRDNDGVIDCLDLCPDDHSKQAPGQCGCGKSEIDNDADTVPDCVDECKDDPGKTEPGECGCGVQEPGQCGCGVPDTDSDNDTVPDCFDECDDDFEKTKPGICGCNTPDSDSDNDTVMDCIDLCPDNPEKNTEENVGVCPCNSIDDIHKDTDADTIMDCVDVCDENDKIWTAEQRDATACGCDKECIPCPEGALQTVKMTCGCYLETITSGDNQNTGDADEDGILDCFDICKNNALITDSLENISDLEAYYATTEYQKIIARCELRDADKDKILDDVDACPTNNKESADNSKCDVYNATTNTFNVRHVLDFDTLKAVLAERKAANNTNTLTINILSDINLAYEWEYVNNALKKTRITKTDNSCVVKSPAFDMKNVKIVGNSKKITANLGDMRCSLDNALINSIQDTDISDLALDFDVSGSGRALLMNTGRLTSSVKNVSVKGTIRTDVETSATTGVGGLIGEVVSSQVDALKFVVDNCYGNGINIYAENANNVGGLIGYVNYMTINPQTKHIAGHIEGNENVGGMFGYIIGGQAYLVTINIPASGMILNDVDEVTGLKNVGGYVGRIASPISNIMNTVNKVSSKGGKNTGGLIGSLSRAKAHIHHIDNQVNTVSSKGEIVGGLCGSVSTSDLNVEIIKNNVKSVSGTQTIGGLVGDSDVRVTNLSDPSDGNSYYHLIQNSVDKVESNQGISGCLIASHGNEKKSNAMSLGQITSACNLVTQKDTNVAGLIGVLPESQINDSVFVSFSANRVMAASSKTVNGSPVYKPMLFPSVDWYTVSHANAVQNLYWFSRGKSGEAGLTSGTKVYGEAFTTNDISTVLSNLNQDSFDEGKFESSSFTLTDDSKSYNIPKLVFKLSEMNQR